MTRTKQQTTRIRIKNLKELIADALILSFSKQLIREYKKQLQELNKELLQEENNKLLIVLSKEG